MIKATILRFVLTASCIGSCLACGRDQQATPIQNANLNAFEETAAAPSQCEALAEPKIGILSYCKTTATVETYLQS